MSCNALIRANRKLPPGKEYKYKLVAAVRACSYTQGKSKTGDTVLKSDFALTMNHTTGIRSAIGGQRDSPYMHSAFLLDKADSRH